MGKIAQLKVLTEVFERYKRTTGEVEEAVVEMYLQGVSTRKIAAITQGLSRIRIGKDAVFWIAQHLEGELSTWRGRPLDLALLVAVGVNEEGYREVLAVEPAGGERKRCGGTC